MTVLRAIEARIVASLVVSDAVERCLFPVLLAFSLFHREEKKKKKSFVLLRRSRA